MAISKQQMADSFVSGISAGQTAFDPSVSFAEFVTYIHEKGSWPDNVDEADLVSDGFDAVGVDGYPVFQGAKKIHELVITNPQIALADLTTQAKAAFPFDAQFDWFVEPFARLFGWTGPLAGGTAGTGGSAGGQAGGGAGQAGAGNGAGAAGQVAGAGTNGNGGPTTTGQQNGSAGSSSGPAPTTAGALPMGSGQLLPGVFQQQTPLQIRGLLFGSLNLGQQPAPPPPASSWTRMIPSGNAIMAIIAVVILFVAMMWWMDFALK